MDGQVSSELVEIREAKCPYCPKIYTGRYADNVLYRHKELKHPEVFRNTKMEDVKMTLTEEDRQAIRNLIAEGLARYESVHADQSAFNHSTVAARSESSGDRAPMHPGVIHLVDRGTRVDALCPECGNSQFGIEKPVVEKQVERIVEKVPDGYIPRPRNFTDLLPYLNAEHEGGKKINDCPNCSKPFQEWLNGIGYVKRR